ncbi:MAG: hypothetical protein ACE5KE_14400 [Methanosarcinales archaeon]
MEDVRIKLLSMEVKKKYKDAIPDPELLRLVGTEPKISLEEEKEVIRQALERKIK